MLGCFCTQERTICKCFILGKEWVSAFALALLGSCPDSPYLGKIRAWLWVILISVLIIKRAESRRCFFPFFFFFLVRDCSSDLQKPEVFRRRGDKAFEVCRQRGLKELRTSLRARLSCAHCEALITEQCSQWGQVCHHRQTHKDTHSASLLLQTSHLLLHLLKMHMQEKIKAA